MQKYVGQMTWSTLDSLITQKSDKGKEFTDLDEETQLKVISNLMSDIGDKAEEYMAKKMNIKEPKKEKRVETPKFKLRSD